MFGSKSAPKQELSSPPAYEQLTLVPNRPMSEITTVQKLYQEVDDFISEASSNGWITAAYALEMRNKLYKAAHPEGAMASPTTSEGPLKAGEKKYVELQEYAFHMARTGKLDYIIAIREAVALFASAYPEGR